MSKVLPSGALAVHLFPMVEIRTRHASRRFLASRDDAGVAHVTTSTWLDALYALGYMHALDRPTQLLFSRAVASGQGAEQIAGHDELFETDCFFRKIGLHLDIQKEVDFLDHKTFRMLTVYCEGVNDGLKDSGRSLPMRATGFQIEPWNQAAVILVGRLLSFGGLAVSQMQNERLLIELVHADASDAAMRELFSPRLDGADFDLLRNVKISNQLSDEALELITDLPRLAGSNAWAVSPSRSASGSALLASDPHLEINRLPAIWYEVVLQWNDGRNYVMGASLPGCPLLAVARTERCAWGVTYMKGDTIDYFVEDCRKAETGVWQYRRGQEWHDFRLRTESIGRKGKEPTELQVRENSLGTIDGDLDEQGEGYHLTVAWAGRSVECGRAITSWLNLVAAQDVAEAMDVVRLCPQPTLCFVMADREGHIGLQGCGRFPRRGDPRGGLVPLPAWDESNHWKGWLPHDVLPRQYDPPEGFVATANEENNPANGPWLVTQALPDYRVRRIRQRLGELPAATVDDMRSLQYDLVSLQARDLLGVFLPYLPDGNVKRRLEGWDCRYSPESCEAALFQHLYVNVMIELLGHDRGVGWRRMLYLCSRVGYSTMVLTAADALLQKDESWWWHGRDKGEMIRRAAAPLESEPTVPWSEINNFHFTDRFFGGHQVGRLLGYDSRRYPMPGCHATPFQGHVCQTASREQTFAPCYHFVTDMGVDEAWTNMPGGASESRFSKYYRNGIPLWFVGEYKRLTISPGRAG